MASATFNQLSVTLLEYVVRVEFLSESYGPENLPELRQDFSQLSDALALNSKVLIDFDIVQEFCAEAIDAMADFNKEIRNKGSRIVLCCIIPNVLENFFPARQHGKT